MTAAGVAASASVGITSASETFSVVDVGTLGGSISSAVAVNGERQVAGYSSLTGDAAVGSFMWTASSGIADLGTLGGNYTVPVAMNGSGQVVGTSSLNDLDIKASPTSLGIGFGANDVLHAFSWTASSGIVDLGTLGGRLSAAAAVNSQGAVVGISTIEDNVTSRAFMWTEAAGMVDLGTLGGSQSEATAINDNGQVVGWSETADGLPHAFLWTAKDGMIDLGTLGGDQSFPTAINAAGQVVGFSENVDFLSHAFLWTAGSGIVDLTPDDEFFETRATGIDENGMVVGVRSTLSGTFAFTWTAASGIVNLDTLGGIHSTPFMILGGQVVGDYGPVGDAQGRPFRWTAAGGMIDLSTLGGTDGRSLAVNAAGDIAGHSYTSGGAQHATLWKAVVPSADSTPPSITPSVTGVVGANGWYMGDVSVAWNVADADSAIVGQTGCDPIVLSADTPGATVTCSATSGGGTATGSVTVRIDRTAPILQNVPDDMTVSAASVNGAQVKYTAPTAIDNLDATPTVQCTPAAGLFGVGDTQVSCQATDAAGNVAMESFNVRVLAPVLDAFNGNNASLATSWCGSRTAFTIRSNSARPIASGPIYWCDGSSKFGVDQEVFVTMSTVDGSGWEQDLLLKVQGDTAPNYTRGEIEVIYDSAKRSVRVATLLPSQSAWTHYAYIPVTLRNGDRFGARALSNGEVWIYINNDLVSKVTLNAADQAFFNTKGGYVGLWFDKALSARFDNFGGGTLTAVPSSATAMITKK